VQLHPAPLNESGIFEGTQAGPRSSEVPPPPVILSAPILEVSVSNSNATSTSEMQPQRVQLQRSAPSRTQTFPNAEVSRIAGWKSNPKMPPPPPSVSGCVGSALMDFHDNVRETVLQGAASLEYELYGTPNSRRTTQDAEESTSARQLRKRARHSL